jgi:hypothetical protein
MRRALPRFPIFAARAEAYVSVDATSHLFGIAVCEISMTAVGGVNFSMSINVLPYDW